MKSKNPIILITSIVLIILISNIIFTQNGNLEPKDVISENDNLEIENLNNEVVIEEPSIDEVEMLSIHKFIDNIEYGIGDSAEILVDKWGSPLEVDYIYGGLYLKYEDYVFYTDGYINEDETYCYGNIITIEADKSYGIKSGITIEESRKVLGEPDGMDIYDELKEYGEGILPSTDFYYRDDYTISIPYDKETKQVNYIRLGTYRPTPDIIGSGFIELTDIERDIYEDYIIDFDEDKINGCTPMNVMKLWLYALQEKNYEAEWELFTKGEMHLGWDKKYHLENLTGDREFDPSVFQNPVNIRVTYDENYKFASISWEDKYLEEYDASGNPFRFSFGIINGGDRIWKVAFTPMQ